MYRKVHYGACNALMKWLMTHGRLSPTYLCGWRALWSTFGAKMRARKLYDLAQLHGLTPHTRPDILDSEIPF